MEGKEAMIRVNFYANKEDDDSLEYVSAKEGISKSWMIRQGIKMYLESIKKKRG